MSTASGTELQLLGENLKLDPAEASVLSLFEARVASAPHRLAVVHDAEESSYAQLNSRAESIAWALYEAGVRKHTRVGMRLQRSTDAIAAMLAAFKLGAAFVPLDPDFPEDRIAFMLEDAEIPIILVDDDWRVPPHCTAQTMDVRGIGCEEVANSVGEILQPCEADDLAYIMYTSGSTGKPKGVLIDHRALTTYCRADVEVYQLQSDDRTLQFSTLCFDIAIEEIFPPLVSGSAIIVRPSERADSANELSAIVNRYGVTALHLATAYWHEWVDLMVASGDRAPQSLRLVIATGEKVSTAHYRRWIDLCDHEVLWCNAYGPTEATVSATVFVPDRDFDKEPMPIGKPLPGYTAYILDRDMRAIDVPTDRASETGTLFVGGPALALGYLNRPELTEKAFVNVSLPDGSERLYCTGDLARWLPDGNIEFGGRVDHQIKLGSYRIEPGEIEAGLTAHKDVLEALVLHEQVGSQKYLVAYVVHPSPSDLDLVDVARHVRENLPTYMVPHRYCVVAKFEKTINGKVDRDALPDPATAIVPTDEAYQPPETPTQIKLAGIWAEVLQVPRIAINDDFFYLGGSSLLAARVISELKKSLDVELPVRDFFAKPILADAADHLDMLLGNARDVATNSQRHRNSVKPEPSFLQTEMGDQLFQVTYRPTAEDVRHCLVVCHPWGHEYVRSYRNLQQLGVQLAGHGLTTRRFDYSGTGNSTGERRKVSFETMREDTLEVLRDVRSSDAFDSVTLLGVRFGATVAAHALEQFNDPKIRLIAWDPVLDGGAFVDLLRSMHTYALQSQTRFIRRRRDASGDQLYGFHFDQDQQRSFAEAAFPMTIGQRIATSVVFSQCSAGLTGTPEGQFVNARVIETNEEVYWENPEFAERAFASREVASSIKKILLSDSSHGSAR